VTLSTQRPEISHKQPGDEPLPGYRLLLPLGRGGFGEVWKCEAPGGLHKAIKFVAADGDRFRQELSAFEQIKAIRHPFILGLDRVEMSGGELVMVMELADCQLHDRFRVCRSDGLAGIPRDELVGYLEEVAESLDMMGTQHGLQHLDVKPENLFVVSGHAKIGDYGLVRRTECRVKDDDNRGFTPRYTAPEVLLGRVDTRSDQYSLALVYAELLTGHFPYTGQNAKQLMMQHLNTPPDLSRVPETDRHAVGRALSKEPSDRYASCLSFVRVLMNVKDSIDSKPIGEVVREIQENTPSPPNHQTTMPTRAKPNENKQRQDVMPTDAVSQHPVAETVAVNRRSNVQQRGNRVLNLRKSEPPPDPFASLYHVMPVQFFPDSSHRAPPETILSTSEYVACVVKAAQENQADYQAVSTEREGVLTANFLCTLPATMIPLKLAIIGERWGLTIQEPDSSQVVLWREYISPPRKPGKSEPRLMVVQPPAGLEVVVNRPAPPSAEFTIQGKLCGFPSDEFAAKAHDDLPRIVSEIKAQLQNLAERRLHPRFRTSFPLLVYPLYPDGIVGSPIGGSCRDISLSGIRLHTSVPIRTERIYVEFHQLQPLAGQAVYVRVLRTSQDAGTQGTITCGRFHHRA
jgi:serine/threonine protein kinase